MFQDQSRISMFLTLSRHSLGKAVKSQVAPGTIRAISSDAGKAFSYCLFDVDANLTHQDLVKDEALHISSAKKSGVKGLVCPGTTCDDSQSALRLAQKYPGVVFACLGVHPYCAKTELPQLKTTLRTIEGLAVTPGVVAIGECGLDYSQGFPDKDLQMQCFVPQVELAAKLGLPLFVHERAAHIDLCEVLDKRLDTLSEVLIHCFTGTEAELKTYLDYGFFISISGSIFRTKKDSELVHLRNIPLDKVMIETDAPYLGFKGCRKDHYRCNKSYPNVPSSLPKVLDKLARIMQCSSSSLAKHTTRNAEMFFRIRTDNTKS